MTLGTEFDRMLVHQDEIAQVFHSGLDVAALRIRAAEVMRYPVADDLTVESVDAAGVDAELVTPPDVSSNRLLIYFHGGAFMIGSAEQFRGPIAEYARAAGMKALLPNYRLAPENPFPAGLTDCVTAYRWALDNGWDPSGIAFAGDSAGGNLAVGAMLAAREAGLPVPAACIALCPVCDMESKGDSFNTNAELDPMISREINLGVASAYLGTDGDPRDPLASPIYADLSGLPPVFVRSGTREVLHSDALQLVERLGAAGVEVDWKPAEGMVHTYYYYVSYLPEAQETMSEMAAFLRAHVA